MGDGRARELKVGIFVSLLTLLVGGVTFLVGGSTAMFEDRYTLNASWTDVGGLKEGAVVRLAGWDVGEVNAIHFSDDPANLEVYVQMSIKTDFQDRIRMCPWSEEDAASSGEETEEHTSGSGSRARIETIGVLGDKHVALTMAPPLDGTRRSARHPQGTPCSVLEDGDWIQTDESLDILDQAERVSEILNSTSSISRKVDLMIGDNQEAAQASLAKSFFHLEEMLSVAKNGDGLLHALVYDEQMPKRVDSILVNLESASSELAAVAHEIRTGDGIASELVYGENGEALAVELRQLTGALSALTTDIQDEESLIHSLLYDPEKVQIIDDLAATVESLRSASAAIEDGSGTLGLLANDPVLYEEMRALVGGAQRNKLLRAYIRQTIKKTEEQDADSWELAE